MELSTDQLAAAFRKSGKSQGSFCTEHGITIHKLRYHLYKRGSRRALTPVKAQVPGALPIKFLTINRHRTDKDNHTMHRQPMTIITGQFSIAEVVEFITGTRAVVC